MEKCIKCGSEDFNIRYWRKDDIIGWDDLVKIDNLKKFTTNNDGESSVYVQIEHLRCTCKVCGYKVAKDTLDNIKT